LNQSDAAAMVPSGTVYGSHLGLCIDMQLKNYINFI
jgi:hypothetical protein